jgi:hypothetical protein
MLSVLMLSVIMLSVVAPGILQSYFQNALAYFAPAVKYTCKMFVKYISTGPIVINIFCPKSTNFHKPECLLD